MYAPAPELRAACRWRIAAGGPRPCRCGLGASLAVISKALCRHPRAPAAMSALHRLPSTCMVRTYGIDFRFRPQWSTLRAFYAAHAHALLVSHDAGSHTLLSLVLAHTARLCSIKWTPRCRACGSPSYFRCMPAETSAGGCTQGPCTRTSVHIKSCLMQGAERECQRRDFQRARGT